MRRALLLGVLCTAWVGAASGSAVAAQVGWVAHSAAVPSELSSADPSGGRIELIVENVGAATSNGLLTLTDRVPAGLTVTATETEEGDGGARGKWFCAAEQAGAVEKCALEVERENPVTGQMERSPEPVPPGSFTPAMAINVSAPAPSATGVLTNTVVVGGGGGAAVQSSEGIQVNGTPQGFALNRFTFQPGAEDASPVSGAGAHPWELTTEVGVTSTSAPPNAFEHIFAPTRNLKDLSVELPLGFAGNPKATGALCTESELRNNECPAASQVGTFTILGGLFEAGFQSPQHQPGENRPVFNLVPQAGYPAEFGFRFATLPIVMYASVVHVPLNGPGSEVGFRLRVSAPGLPARAEPIRADLTFFGHPSAQTGTTGEKAFLSNPVDCSSEPVSARVEVEPWGAPGGGQSAETLAYPGALSGCGLLGFSPTLGFAPSEGAEGTTLADEPSGYDARVALPQRTAFSEPASPQLRTAQVTLPEGLSVNPAAGNGLQGCQETGPAGINIGSGSFEATGHGLRDVGDPEATELGAGHPGGNESPYDDGLYHTAPGHCPDASIVGTAEVFTPLLDHPLTGHVFVASPRCGGEAQPACTPADAADGKLFRAYLEAAGSGVIVKLASTLTANLTTGQLTATFRENPQFPVSEVKIHLTGGPQAVFANPQTCGSSRAVSTMTSWSEEQANPAGEPFSITGCPATQPFAPAFKAGTNPAAAGAPTTFSLTLSRQDREGDLSQLAVRTPAGIGAILAGVPLCGEPQAAQGTCPAGSRIASVTATAGAGSSPLALQGQAFLTGPYRGAPFGLSIVVPAKAGPFNLGNVVERAAISIDPSTAQVTITTDPLTQIKDGIPIRLRSIDTVVDRPGFMYNPTNCGAQQITATVTSAQGASANVSAPFAAYNCASLPFHPSLTAATRGQTSKLNGASLTVRVSAKPGESNIRRVDLRLPKILPSRNETLNKACTEQQFAKNPAGCPEASFIGTAAARTPVLSTPLEGPAILVSHGGAAFPDVEFVLQSQGVTVILDGKTFIDKQGFTYSHFETVPDAPISSFETVLPEGRHSILAAYIPSSPDRSFCDSKIVTVKQRVTVREHGHARKVTRTVKKHVPETLTVPTTITAQNGAVLTQTTPVAVTGCAKAKAAKSSTKSSKAARKR